MAFGDLVGTVQSGTMSGGTTTTLTITSATAGNSIVAAHHCASSDAPVTVTSDQGDTFTVDVTPDNGSANARISSARDVTGATHVLTFTFTDQVDLYNAKVFASEHEGEFATPADATYDQDGSGVHSTNDISISAPTSSPAALFDVYGEAQSGGLTGPTGWTSTILESDTLYGFIAQVTAAADNANVTFTAFNGNDIHGAVAYTEAGGGGGRTTKNTRSSPLGMNVGMN